MRQKELYANTKIALNELLARPVNTPFEIAEEIKTDENLLLPELMDLAEKQNPQLQTQIINKRVAELQAKQVKANRYPIVSINSGYNLTRSESSLGFVAQSSGNGFTYGISASMRSLNGRLAKQETKKSLNFKWKILRF